MTRSPNTFNGFNGPKIPIVKSNTVVLLIDMQKDFVGRLRKGEANRIIPNQINVLRQCTAINIPVIVLECRIRKYGKTTKVLSEILRNMPSIYCIEKALDDGFTEKALSELLQIMGASTLILIGINADHCVKDTARGAIHRGYEIVTSNDVISGQNHHDHDNSSWWYQSNGTWTSSASCLVSGLI